MSNQVVTVTSKSEKPKYWAAPQKPHERVRDFTFGFCGCCDECGLCVYAYFCICCLIAENSARLDGMEAPCGCCYPSSVVKNRVQAKAQFGIRLSCGVWGDFCAACCFPCCSEIQVKREIELHRTGQQNQMAHELTTVITSPVSVQTPYGQPPYTPNNGPYAPNTPNNQGYPQGGYPGQQQMYANPQGTWAPPNGPGEQRMTTE